MSFQTIAKGDLLDTYLPPASSDSQRWPFVSRIFLLSWFFLSCWFFLFLRTSNPDGSLLTDSGLL